MVVSTRCYLSPVIANVRNRYLAAHERVLPFRALIRIGRGPQARAARCNCDSTIFIKRASRWSASKPCAIDYRWPHHHRCTLVSLAIQDHRPICRCPKFGWRSLSALAIRKGFLLYIKQPKSRKAITQSRVQKVIVAVNSGYEPS